MKTFNTLLLTTLFTILTFGISVAQSSSSNVIARGNIAPVITTTTISDLELGELVIGTTTTVQPTDVGAGQFNISSSNNNTRYTFTITYTPLTQTVTGTTLPYTLITRGSNVENDNTNLFVINDGTTYNSGPGQGPIFGPILKSIYIGAEVVVPNNQDGGSYESTITLTVTIF